VLGCVHWDPGVRRELWSSRTILHLRGHYTRISCMINRAGALIDLLGPENRRLCGASQEFEHIFPRFDPLLGMDKAS
jgi:hypothetical protein